MSVGDLSRMVSDQHALLVQLSEATHEVARAIETRQLHLIPALVGKQRAQAATLLQAQSALTPRLRGASSERLPAATMSLAKVCESLLLEVITLEQQNERALAALRQTAHEQAEPRNLNGARDPYEAFDTDTSNYTRICTHA